WQWQRAWAEAFDADLPHVAWRWHRGAAGALPDTVPRPQAFAPVHEVDADGHASLLAAWAAPGAWAEPRWRGARVHVVRRAGEVAVWQRGGALLNAVLEPALLEAARWPDPCVIEAVVVGWRDGRVVAAADALSGGSRAARPSAGLRLVLTDW